MKRHDPARTDRDGFSLVEILVVLMILAVGILPVAIVQHQARQEVVKSELHGQAVIVCQSQLERIKSRGFGAAAPDSGVAGRIAWNAQVTNVSFGLDRINVTATWQSNKGTETMSIADLVSLR
ncbi:MAG: prepilin-type N-terminal cleavage/methylation domain-containing protein [bacterium]|nr:prepilin-type N-terminal cleavage/methylation domain-containing protein [bacterium]